MSKRCNFERRRRWIFRHFNVFVAVPTALYSAFVHLTSFADVIPVPDLWTSNTNLEHENSANRNNGFQVLANGISDLAALVGLVATDGVEMCSID